MSLESNIEVEFPSETGIYKVIQLMVNGKPYIIFEKGVNRYQRQILTDFLIDNNISHDTVSSAPKLKGERYEVYGMGFAAVVIEQNVIILSGQSIEYGIRINEQHLQKIQELYPNWEFINKSTNR